MRDGSLLYLFSVRLTVHYGEAAALKIHRMDLFTLCVPSMFPQPVEESDVKRAHQLDVKSLSDSIRTTLSGTAE